MGGQIHPAFGEKYKKLIIQVEELKERNPEGYQQHPATKFLNNINEFIFRRISEDPSAPEFRQGKNMINDADLQIHWSRVIKRISPLSSFDGMEIDKFQYSWQEEYQNNQNLHYKNKLINAVLMLVKSKEYWKQILPDDNWTHSESKFREQLSLEIGKFYSKQDCIVENHIPFFFKTLYKLIEE